MTTVTIVDYGNGNANSIRNALAELRVSTVYSAKALDIANAERIILPGVGHHGAAMATLRSNGLVDALCEAAHANRRPVLGICLGMQLMTRFSEEGNSTGLGWIPAETRKIAPSNRKKFKVPHVGWNTVSTEPRSTLLRGIDTNCEPFYFCHAFAVELASDTMVSASFQYDRTYTALAETNNIFGVQFHPEKSQGAGLALLRNFMSVTS